MSSPPPIFDPRQVPVLSVDDHLPRVQSNNLLSQTLVQRFASPRIWTPELLGDSRFSDRAPTRAAVLVPLVMRDHGLQVLLTQRASHLSSHSGQISFPGGKTDPIDTSAIDTALRETQEEVGLDRVKVQVLGSLPIYTTGSAFLVTPVVGLIEPDFLIIPNPNEVAEVFEVPLAFLMDPSNHRRHSVKWEGAQRDWFSMPYTQGSTERFIWGATAGMLRNFYRFLLD